MMDRNFSKQTETKKESRVTQALRQGLSDVYVIPLSLDIVALAIMTSEVSLFSLVLVMKRYDC